MTHPRLLLGTLLTLLICVGCAPRGALYTDYLAGDSGPTAGMGRVYVYRPSAFPLLGPSIQVHVNDAPASPWLSQRHFLVINQPEGEVRVRIYGGEQVSFRLPSGETRYVRVAVSLGPLDSGHLYLELADAHEARSELEGLRLAGEVAGQADPFR